MYDKRCSYCARAWTNLGTDFGFGFFLRPVMGQGIEVRVRGESICWVSREELQAFLDGVYGPPA